MKMRNKKVINLMSQASCTEAIVSQADNKRMQLVVGQAWADEIPVREVCSRDKVRRWFKVQIQTWDILRIMEVVRFQNLKYLDLQLQNNLRVQRWSQEEWTLLLLAEQASELVVFRDYSPDKLLLKTPAST